MHCLTAKKVYRWLYSQGRKAESVSVLARLFNCAENDPRIKRTEEEMDNAIRFEQESTKFSIKHLIYDTTEAKNTRRLVLCFLLQFFQQFTGINVIAFYGKTHAMPTYVPVVIRADYACSLLPSYHSP